MSPDKNNLERNFYINQLRSKLSEKDYGKRAFWTLYPMLHFKFQAKSQKISRPENFANQVIREISLVLMEFNFANQ